MQNESVVHFFEDDEDRRIFNREMLIFKATELISIEMQNKKIRKSKLAKLLKKSKGYISQLLSGETNMTLRTLADVMTALGEEIEISVKSCLADVAENESEQNKTVIEVTGSNPNRDVIWKMELSPSQKRNTPTFDNCMAS